MTEITTQGLTKIMLMEYFLSLSRSNKFKLLFYTTTTTTIHIHMRSSMEHTRILAISPVSKLIQGYREKT